MNEAILTPFLGMMLLTLLVWVTMYVKRLGYIARERIDPGELTTPARAAKLIPERVGYAANNFRNLLELPVLFYALCIYLYVTATVDSLYVGMAWGFFGLRAVHSTIHCTINRVRWRFIAYMLASTVLWIMLLRAVLQLVDSPG